MRLVQLANFWSPRSGGLRVAIDRLRRGYAEAGIETALVVPGSADDQEVTPWGRIIRLKSPVLPRSGGIYRVVTARAALLRVLEELQPDRIEVSDKLTMVAAARWASRQGIPSVLLSHERLDAILSPRVPGWFPLGRPTGRWNAWLAEQFDTVVCTSRFSAREFGTASNVTCVPLGVDLETFRPRPSRAAPSPGLRLITVGRLSKEKRPELTIAALRTLRLWGVEARLTVIGDGPMLDELRHRAKGLPADFLGHLDDRDLVAAELAAADVAIAPCPAEAFGLAPLEAMASGTPVVVARRSGAAELVTPGAGIAATSGPRDIARAVVELGRSPRHEREAAARLRAEEFPWERTIRTMLQIHRLDPAPVA